MALKSSSHCRERNEFGRKMYLVVCLQRGLLDEALKTALKIQENIPNDSTLKELIRCIPQRMRQLEIAASENEASDEALETTDTDTDDGFGSYSSDSSDSDND